MAEGFDFEIGTSRARWLFGTADSGAKVYDSNEASSNKWLVDLSASACRGRGKDEKVNRADPRSATCHLLSRKEAERGKDRTVCLSQGLKRLHG